MRFNNTHLFFTLEILNQLLRLYNDTEQPIVREARAPVLVAYPQHVTQPAAPAPQTFEQQLSALGVSEEEIPAEFIDPITLQVMENPVVAKTSCENRGNEQITQYCYDQETFTKFDGICPADRQFFIEVSPNTALKERIAQFVKEKQKAQQISTDFELAQSLQDDTAQISADHELALALQNENPGLNF